MRQTGDALQQHGPFGLYREPFPRGARGMDTPRLDASRGVLIGATQQMLDGLQTLRSHARQHTPPKELVPPNVVQRHSLVCVGVLLLAACTLHVGLEL